MEREESMIERRLRQNVAAVEEQAARIAALEAQLDAARAERNDCQESLASLVGANVDCIRMEAERDAARADLARYVAGIDAQREAGRAVLTRLIQLVEEWERADCTSSTHDCAEQVRAILRGEGPQGWESKEGGA